MNTAEEAAQLKKSAANRLLCAVHFLELARQDLCNLEGEGYCDFYEGISPLVEQIEERRKKLIHLPAPTGVFKI